MKKYFLLLFSVLMISTFSCNKDDNNECETNGTGEIKIENRATYQAEVTVNMDTPFIMEPDEKVTLTLSAGSYNVTAIEVGGLMIPTGFNGTLEVCSTRNLVIGM